EGLSEQESVELVAQLDRFDGPIALRRSICAETGRLPWNLRRRYALPNNIWASASVLALRAGAVVSCQAGGRSYNGIMNRRVPWLVFLLSSLSPAYAGMTV